MRSLGNQDGVASISTIRKADTKLDIDELVAELVIDRFICKIVKN